MDLDTVLRDIDNSVDDVTDKAVRMIRIPSIGPDNGGKGESAIADELMTWLSGFDSVERINIPQNDVIRSNIIAKKNGKMDRTLWFIAHIDTVSPGDLSEWEHPPFEPFIDNGRIYGLGAEDNGQGLLSSYFASRYLLGEEFKGYSLGIAFVADEETTSRYGIQYLLDHGYFGKDDIAIVPDWGSHRVRFTVIGKRTHGSTPNKGLNAYRIGAAFLTELVNGLYNEFDMHDELFRPGYSTFEPTKRSPTVENINIIPNIDEFWMDCRILPSYDINDVLDLMNEIKDEFIERTGAEIRIETVQAAPSGPSSSTGTLEFKALCECIRDITGREAVGVGLGGGTCANFFRNWKMNAYAWSSEGGTLHKPNEYLLVDNVITDAKVFASLIHRLCINNP